VLNTTTIDPTAATATANGPAFNAALLSNAPVPLDIVWELRE
jgi:hypothetical protein